MNIPQLFCLAVALALLLPGHLSADNGVTAYAYPVEGLTIDGDLSDWPATVEKYPIELYHFGMEANSPDDLQAYWQAGYDAEQGLLYIGTTVTDDDYVKTPDNNRYDVHDFQVLYLDLIHTSAPDGVFAYEIDEHHRKIVEQENLSFYPQVQAANWNQVEVAIRKVGKTIFYEWQLKLPKAVDNCQVIGFDYAVFDKDQDQQHTEVSWGPQSVKFRSDRRLGDLVLLEKSTALHPTTGQLVRMESDSIAWPATVQLTSADQPVRRHSAAVDSTGRYSIKLPAGQYTLSVPSFRDSKKWFAMDLIEQVGDPLTVSIGPDSPPLPPVNVAPTPKPNLLPKRGLLQKPFTSATAREVDDFVEAYQAYYGIPAVSLVLIQNGQQVYHQSYGVENIATKAPLREKAVFEAASITKSVFAYAVNRMVQRGELDLDQPLHELAPFPQLEEDHPEYKRMTTRHVLTHVSGLPNWGARLINTPGTKLGYSGEGFEYLKRAVAGDIEDEWPALTQSLLEKEVLRPLGMTNTYFSCNDSLAQLKVAGHVEEVPMPYDCPDRPGVAYSMHTEAADFLPFALALLERKGLTPEQAAEMFDFQTLSDEENWLNGYKTGFGLGIALRESTHGLVFGHGGNNGDFRCNFEVYDELKTGYIVFTNADTGGPLLFDLAQFLVEGEWE